MQRLAAIGLLSLSASLLLLACGSPTLEEACESYCEWIKSTDCGETLPTECGVGCGQLEKALKDAGQGDCIDAYTAALDCIPGSDFVCFNGFPVPTDTGCLEEAQDLAQCVQGSVNED
jgi:hypothetical protein